MQFKDIGRDGLPNKNGKYLTIIRGLFGDIYIDIYSFATNLYEIDKYDFAKRKGKPGWYDYDGEYGYFEINNVLAWTDIPEIPEEYKRKGGK